MTVTHGMDTAAGLAVGDTLAGGADEIAVLAQRIDGLLADLDWNGRDAEQARTTWRDVERPRLDRTSEHLATLAAAIRDEAAAQDRASGNGSHGASGSWETATGSGGVLGWLDRRLDAFGAGLKRLLRADADLLGKVVDVLTGERDWSVAAVAASALTVVGSSAGAVLNAATGEDAHWFDESSGRVDPPVPVPLSGGTASQPTLMQPRDTAGLMQGVVDAYTVGEAPGSSGDIRITRVDNGNGVAGYVVAIPGTENWNPSAGPYVRDATANLHLLNDNSTAAVQTVQQAMAAAGIPPGAPVLLVGHSQGGIIAGELASDPTFLQQYNVTNVVTFGAPIDHIDIDPGVRVLQVQHGADVVPRLDLGGVRLGTDPFPDRATTVTLESPGGLLQPLVNHNQQLYVESVRDALAADGEAGDILRNYQGDPSMAPFLVGDGESATGVDIGVRRGGRDH